jgi:hypothetical protein
MKDDDEFAGWWREGLVLATLARHRLPLLGAATLGLGGCYDYVRPDQQEAQRADEMDSTVDALALQQKNGWNVGLPDDLLVFNGSSVTDSAGTQSWRYAMEGMATALQPASPQLQPWYVPTLFQSLIGDGGFRLRALMRPIHTPEMHADFERGLAIRALMEQAGWPSDVAIVVDAPGPSAVAISAALSDRFDPVFTFGNWPHPAGVVPSHETLAAVLFFQPLYLRERAQRPAGAPPVFVLDSNRLEPYQDADSQFDNRYFVKLPHAEALAALGIKHVLYVSADGIRELDDLNAGFVDLQQHGIDVHMMALGELVRDDEAVINSDGEDEEEDEQPPIYVASLSMMPWFYFYGGSWWDHSHFWRDCGWGWPHGGGSLRAPSGVVIGAPSGTRARGPLIAHAWSPSARATIFGTGAARLVTPGRLGQVSVRASRVDGSFRALGTSHGTARFGSLGRTGGGGFG